MLKGKRKRMSTTTELAGTPEDPKTPVTRPLPVLPDQATREQLIAALAEQAEVIVEQKTAGRALAVRVKKAHGFCSEGVNEFMRAASVPLYGEGDKTVKGPDPVDESLYTEKGLRDQFAKRAEKYAVEVARMRRIAIDGHMRGHVTASEVAEFTKVFHIEPLKNVTRVAGSMAIYADLPELGKDAKDALRQQIAAATVAILAAAGGTGIRTDASLYGTNRVV